MAFSNDLRVNILGDTKGLERSFARANQATATFGRNVEGVGAKVDKTAKSFKGFATGAATGFAGAVAVTEGVQQIKAAVDVASSLQEQISRSNVTFSTSAEVIQDWAETTATSLGIAEDQALAAASAFGGLFAQSGSTAADAARLSKAVVTLGADLASFADTSVDEALNALRSGLSGEIEPLRRFEVFLTEAAVAQRAMADTGKDNVKQLTQGEKIMARWNLILEQTTRQQGDVSRTSESFANQQRKLAAQTRDLQASLGTLLLPVLTDVVSRLNDAAGGALILADGLRKLASIQIPTIEIPFVVTIGGRSLGDLARGGLGILKFTPLNPLFGLTIANEIANQFRDQAEEATPGLTSQLQEAMDKLISDALGAVKPFGITVLPTFAERFAAGMQAAIDAAQKIAADTVKEGQARIDRASRLEQAELGLQVAQGTVNNLKDDLAALRVIEAELQNQIKAGQNIAENQRRLVGVQNDIKQTSAQIEQNKRNQARAQRQSRQFRALGLSTTGEEIIPGIENLQQRINGALRRINSGELDVSSKLVERLKLARALIKKEGKNLTDETRQVINDLIKTVTQGTKKLEDKEGPLTKTMGLNVQKTLEGLGLTPEVERELRARLSGVNSAGRQLAGNNRPTGSFRTPGGTQTTQVDVYLDNEKVGKGVTKSQQKNSRRNPKQKQGPRSGI